MNNYRADPNIPVPDGFGMEDMNWVAIFWELGVVLDGDILMGKQYVISPNAVIERVGDAGNRNFGPGQPIGPYYAADAFSMDSDSPSGYALFKTRTLIVYGDDDWVVTREPHLVDFTEGGFHRELQQKVKDHDGSVANSLADVVGKFSANRDIAGMVFDRIGWAREVLPTMKLEGEK